MFLYYDPKIHQIAVAAIIDDFHIELGISWMNDSGDLNIIELWIDMLNLTYIHKICCTY